MQTLVDFITGETVPDTGAEANRQVIEQLLVNAKGFDKKDIEVDADIRLTIAGEPYRSQVDLVISVDETRFMTIKCAAGSLGRGNGKLLRHPGCWIAFRYHCRWFPMVRRRLL